MQYFSYFLSLKISYQKCSSFSILLKHTKKLTIIPSDVVVNWICLTHTRYLFVRAFTAQKMKFFIKDFFSECDQICSKLWIRSHLLNKSLMENFIFCAVSLTYKLRTRNWLKAFNFHVSPTVLIFSSKISQNNQTHFKNLTTNAIRFLKCVCPFWDIMH